MDLTFKESKETKGAWQFHEVTPDDGLSEPKVGTLYVRKSTLREMGWASGVELHVRLELAS